MRSYERSTAAHNTVEVDGANSTEVWGAFRAARRARVPSVVARVDGGVRDGRGRPRRVPPAAWPPGATAALVADRPGLRVDDLVTGHGRARDHGALAPGARIGLAAGADRASAVASAGRRAFRGRPRYRVGTAVTLAAGRHAPVAPPGSAGPSPRRCWSAAPTPSCPSGSAPSGAGRTPSAVSAGEPAFALESHVKQIVQPLAGGPVEVLDVPRPVPDATEVLVRTVASVISPGTERAVTALAQASLLAKARARPDLVRQVIKKARTDGLAATAQTVRGRLAEDLPLGYSAAGIVLEAGRGGHRGPAGPAGGDRRRGQGQPRGVPGRARACSARPCRTASRPRTRPSPRSPRSRCTACAWPTRARDRRSWSSASA